MFNFDQFFDSLGIFYANLIPFHIFAMIISWLAFVISYWKILPSNYNKKNKNLFIEENLTFKKDSTEDMSLQTQYKLARQKLVEKKLTPEQRSKEKETEAQQLAAILKLLQEKSETFQVDSMDQLEDQLRLYRK